MFMAIFHPLSPPVSKTGSLCQTTTDRRQTESIMVHGLSNYLLPPDVSPAGLHTGAGGGLNTAFLSHWDNNVHWFNNPNEQTQ